MSSECVITLDHPNGVYNSGDTLNGNVKLQTDKTITIRGISIAVIGYGKIAWTDRNNNSKKFSAHEKYLNSLTYVVGSENGSSFDLEAAIYNYTMTCELPKELPTSVIELQVKVKYKIIVTIHRPYIFNDVFKKDFIVNHISDLNLLQLIDRDPRKSYSKMSVKPPILSVCCRDNGDIKAILEVPTDGFIPGQQIPYRLYICNNSNYNISQANIKLLKYYILSSTEPYKHQAEYNKELLYKVFERIPRNTNKEFNDSLLVPNVPPTNSTKFCRFGYKILVKICVGYVKYFFVQLPVIIGTIPLISNQIQPIVHDIPMSINPDNDSMSNISTKEILHNEQLE